MDGTAVGCVATAIVALVAAGGGVAEAAEAAEVVGVGAADADRRLPAQRNRAPARQALAGAFFYSCRTVFPPPSREVARVGSSTHRHERTR
jgi:hypothetical protein